MDQPTKETDTLTMVGLGASAGGLRALESFFDHAPMDVGIAWVVVQHLSPDFKSLMEELLARHTDLPIRRIADGMAITPDTVFLKPPKAELTIADNHFQLRDPEPKQRVDLPIDAFFTSMADRFGPACAGVVLSGTGSDGSNGIRAIHEAGGLVVVQSEETAEFDGMPNSAIATQLAHQVLAPTAMPTVIRDHLLGITSASPKDVDHPFRAILDHLTETCGIDFHGYKRTTVSRRLDRRMGLRYVTDANDYLAILQADDQERMRLLDDLLIGVTGFFRDPDAFVRLRESLVPLLQARKSSEEIRAWVSGCATGEEAYSLGIALLEAARACDHPGRIRIFATDVHRQALDRASTGIYPADALQDMDPTVVARWFEPLEGNRYRVIHSLRDCIVFAVHNVLADPPFTGLDLVTCRNLLIYFQPRMQDYALCLFQYALSMDGVLFLGSSEGLGRFEEDFTPIDSKWKIFRKHRNRSLPLRGQRSMTGGRARIRSQPPAPRSTNIDERRLLRDYDSVLAHCDVSAILVDDRRRPLHLFGDANKYLSIQGGRFEDDLLSMLEPDLRITVGTALQRTTKGRVPTHSPGTRVTLGGKPQLVDVTVQLLNHQRDESDRFLVLFQAERSIPTNFDESDLPASTAHRMHQRIEDLEQELLSAKESLQTTVEELQTTNEELQSTNEELQAANEELQSANEELHSVNEELYTVNAEYEQKNRELAELNRDHENLLRSSDVGTVFLDQDLRIRKFNPAIEAYFKLMPQDIGRPINHIAYNLDGFETLVDQLQEVMRSGQAIENELELPGPRWLWRRIVPFREEGNAIGGAILTFTDVTKIHRRAAAQRGSKEPI